MYSQILHLFATKVIDIPHKLWVSFIIPICFKECFVIFWFRCPNPSSINTLYLLFAHFEEKQNSSQASLHAAFIVQLYYYGIRAIYIRQRLSSIFFLQNPLILACRWKLAHLNLGRLALSLLPSLPCYQWKLRF